MVASRVSMFAAEQAVEKSVEIAGLAHHRFAAEQAVEKDYNALAEAYP